MSRIVRLQQLAPLLLLSASSCGGELGSLTPLSQEVESVVPPCTGAMCPVYPVRSSAAVEQPLVGGAGGEPFGAVCREDQVLIGIRALVADDLWGLGVNCGSLELSSTSSGYTVSVLPLDQLSHLAPQPRHLAGDDVPDQLVIDGEVAVDQPVAHAGHGAPVDRGRRLPQLGGQTLRRFADDLQAAHEGAPEIVARQGLSPSVVTSSTGRPTARSSSSARSRKRA